MKTYCWIALLTLAGAVWGQPPDTLWTRTYGSETEYSEQTYAMCPTLDGGFVLAGIAYETSQMLVVRTDNQGNPIWTRTYGSDAWNWASTVQYLPNGDFLIAGYIDDILMFALRINALGDTVWSRTYQRLLDSDDYIRASVVLSDEGALLVGTSNTGNSMVYALRINAVGDTIWTFSYDHSETHTSGFAVALAPDSSLVIAGGLWTIDVNESDFLMLNLTEDGDLNWERSYGTDDFDVATSVLPTPDGGFILSGYSAIGPGPRRIYLVRTDSIGDTIWTRIYEGYPSITANGICLAPGGGYVVVGTINVNIAPWDRAHMFALRVDEQGDTLWSRLFSRSDTDEATCILPTPDGAYVIAGHSHTPGRGFDMYLVKTLPDPFDTDIHNPVFPSDFNVSVYPNPFNSTTTLSFSLTHTSSVSLTIFNLLGQAVYQSDLGRLNAGEHRQIFDASELPSGIYLARVQVGEMSKIRKMVLLK